MAVAMCVPHKNRGLLRSAAKVINGVPMCEDCFNGKEIVRPERSRFPSPAEQEAEEQANDFPIGDAVEKAREEAEDDMPAAIPESHTEAMQKDRDAGMRTADIAKKYEVSLSMVYKVTRAPAFKGGKLTANAERAEAAPIRSQSAKKNGERPIVKTLRELLERLDGERKMLDEAEESAKKLLAMYV